MGNKANTAKTRQNTLEIRTLDTHNHRRNRRPEQTQNQTQTHKHTNTHMPTTGHTTEHTETITKEGLMKRPQTHSATALLNR